MKEWIKNNINNIIIGSFLIPILLVAFVSISHVTTFYGLSNPFSWAIYLSVAVEIAALASLAGISAKFGRFIYIPFGIVTLIQFVGNFFYSYSFVNMDSDTFKNWVDMISGIFEIFGVEPTNFVAHRRILAFLTGGMIPFISLTFAHMLIVYSYKIQETKEPIQNLNFDSKIIDEISKSAGASEKQSIVKKWEPSESELEEFEKNLLMYQKNEESIENDEKLIIQEKQDINNESKLNETVETIKNNKNTLYYKKNV